MGQDRWLALLKNTGVDRCPARWMSLAPDALMSLGDREPFFFQEAWLKTLDASYGLLDEWLDLVLRSARQMRKIPT